MKEIIKVQDIKVGMYVIMPVGWRYHTFLFNQFLIKNQKQINQIHECDITEVTVDWSKSKIQRSDFNPVESDRTTFSTALYNAKSALKDVIEDAKAEPLTRAQNIYDNSKDIYSLFFNNPKDIDITEFKNTTKEIVDVIINDADCSRHLMMVSAHDSYTATHCLNVGIFAAGLAQKVYKTFSNQKMLELGTAFFMHDIGKVNIDMNIINKQGKLSDDEWSLVRKHPRDGWEKLSNSGNLTEECGIVTLQHHERADGEGYPLKLKGDEIHEFARICSIADVFDALISERSYKKPMPPFQALQIMRDEMLSHFHRELFEQFVLMFADLEKK